MLAVLAWYIPAKGVVSQRRDSRPKARKTSRAPAGAKKQEKSRRAGRFYGDTLAKGARCSSMINSSEGCSLSSEDALWRRVLAVQRQGTRPKAGSNSRTPWGGEKRRKGSEGRDTLAKGARCSSMIHSGEGCSLPSDNALWRRVLAVQRQSTRPKARYNSRTPAGAKKNKKKAGGQRGFTVTLWRRVLAVAA